MTGPGRPELDRDAMLVDALRRGDEVVFAELVDRWTGAMLRLAMARVASQAIAEEVVQEAWLTVLRSLNRFEYRSALRTWVLGIVVNLARSQGRVERRSVPLVADSDEPAVEPSRFLPADHPRWPHHWATEPVPWPTPEQNLLAEELRAVILAAIAQLPEAQREVIVLRDLEDVTTADICNILGLTGTHVRVLLHRARSRVRAAIERYMAATAST